MFNAVAYRRFHTLSEAIRNPQIGEGSNHLFVNGVNPNRTLSTRLIPAIMGNAAIPAVALLFLILRAHSAVVIITHLMWLAGDATSTIHPIMENVSAHFAFGFAVTHQVLSYHLARLKLVVRDKSLMLTFEPLRTMSLARASFTQCPIIDRLCVADPPRIHTVLHHVAHHLLIDWLLPLSKFLYVGVRIHPCGDFRVAVLSGHIQPKGTSNNRCRTRVNIQPCWSLRRRLGARHENIAEWGNTTIKLAINSTILFSAFRFATEIARIERCPTRQHLFHQRRVGRIIIIFTKALDTVKFQSVLMPQQHLDHHSMAMIARQAVKFPKHHSIEFAALCRRL